MSSAPARGLWRTVWASTTDLDPRLVLKLHTGPMSAIAFAEIEQRPLAAVGLRQGGVRVGDLLSGELHELPGEEPVRSLAFASMPGGPVLLTGHRDGKLRVWRLADGSSLRTIDTGDHGVSEIHVAQTRLVTRDSSCQVRCWSLLDGAPLEGPPRGFAIDISGENALVAGDDGMVLWDLKTGRWSSFPAPRGLRRVLSVALSSLDGQTLATVMDDAHRIATLDVPTGGLRAPFVEAHTNKHWDDLRDIWSIDTPHPPLAVVAGTLAVPARWRVYLWDVTTSEPAAPTIAGPVAESMVRAVRWQDRELLLTASTREGVVALWDLGIPVDREPGHDQRIFKVVTDRTVVVSADKGGTFLARDEADGRLLAAPLATGVEITRAMTAWRDGDQIIAAQGAGSKHWSDGKLRRWDLTNGQPYGPPIETQFRFVHWIRRVTLAGGEALLTFGPPGILKLWQGARLVGKKTTHSFRLTGLATTTVGGRPVAALSFTDGLLSLYTLDDLTAAAVTIPEADEDVVLDMTGPHIITGHASNSLHVWHMDGHRIGAGIAGGAEITAVVAKGWPHAYIGRADGSVALADLETGEDLCPPTLLPATPSTMAVTADGDLIVGYGSDVARLHPPA